MPQAGRRLRIVIVEHSTNTAASLQRLLPTIIDPLGYHTECFLIEPEQVKKGSRHVIKLVDDHISEDKCDLLFTDLSFGTSNISPGLDLIESVRRKFPHVFVIACSVGMPNYQDISRLSPYVFNIFLPKRAFLRGSTARGNADWHDWLREHLQQDFRIATDIDIEYNPDERDKRAVRSEEDPNLILTDLDITSIVRQCLWSGPETDSEFLPSLASAKVLGEGRSGSLVLRMELEASNSSSLAASNGKMRFVPVIVKISELQKARKERSNFERYVKLILPYNWRIDVIGYGETREWGGIAYSVVFGAERGYQALTEVLKRGDEGLATQIVDRVFGASGNIWYSPKFTADEPDLRGHYFNRYFTPQGRLDNSKLGLARCLTRCGVDDKDLGMHRHKIYGREHPDPEAMLFDNSNLTGTTTVCHGDLNSNNILLTPDGAEISFIDFQETGRGHVFEDFVALESSVRMYFRSSSGIAPNQSNLDRLINAEFALIKSGGEGLKESGVDELVPYAALVSHIRRKAAAIFPTARAVEYWFAVAAFHFRLARLGDLNDVQRIRVIGCMFAALRSLQEFEAATLAGSSSVGVTLRDAFSGGV